MTTYTIKLISIIYLVFIFNFSANSMEVTAPHNGINLVANLEIAEGKSIQDDVIVMMHGTLAHGELEILKALQTQLKDRGFNSLSMTLSLGLDKRKGLYDCNVPHTHKHTDALDETGVWIRWLKEKGVKKINLLGHSRGGNQIAWFAAERHDSAVEKVILVAPMTWDKQRSHDYYSRVFKKELQPLLNKAQQLVAAGKPDEWLDNIDFVYCRDAKVQAASFVSYHGDDPRLNTSHHLAAIKQPVLVFAGTEDSIVTNVIEDIEPVADGEHVRLVKIEGADHFFRDLFVDDLVENIVEFLEKQ